MKEIETVCVLGLGYVGLPTASILASTGLNVIGVDIDHDVIAKINEGKATFTEPDLQAVIAGVVAKGNLRAASDVPHADAYIIAVPTPYREDYGADLGSIRQAAVSIAPQLRGGELVVLESTSPPGTTVDLAHQIVGLRPDLTLEPGNPNTVAFAH